nr:hypothetical protein CFP56_65272 [Quercus suber]
MPDDARHAISPKALPRYIRVKLRATLDPEIIIVLSPLLSYIDVRHPVFLPKGLSLSEAWRLGPHRITEGSLLPARDSFTGGVFHSRVGHIPVEKPTAEESDFKMVVRRKMNADLFILKGQAFGGWSTP